MRTLFVTGTDTGVGKTVASAILLAHASQSSLAARYYKPIQTGILEDDDAKTIVNLLNSNETDAHFGLSFKRPLSPHLAARYEGSTIDDTDLLLTTKKCCIKDFNVIEGAGGLLVPINSRYLMIDFIKDLEVPCVLVARSTLGTINHTLLSIEALRAREIPLHGVIMMGHRNQDNEASIKEYGRIENVLPWPILEPLDHKTLMAFILQNKAKLDEFATFYTEEKS